MTDIVERLRFDAARCELQFSKGVAGNIEEAAAEIERLRERCERLHVIAKNVSHALMSFTPGGSEYFTRVQIGDFEDYYADADACQRRVRERITKAEDAARGAFRAVTNGDYHPDRRGSTIT